jgi:hypothetical protein
MVTNKDCENIIKEFDFERVRIAMEALNWSYLGGNETPTVEQLETMARTLYDSVDDWNVDEYRYVASGGFEWSKQYQDDNLALKFIIESIDWIGGEHDDA